MFKDLLLIPLALSPLSLTDVFLDGLIARNILVLNGTSMYAELNTPIVVPIGEKIKINFSTERPNVAQGLINDYVEFDAGNLLQLVDCTATIDDEPVADGASIAAYQDGGYYWIELTATAELTINFIGKKNPSTGYWSGQVLSIGDYVLNSGSAVYDLKDNSSLGLEEHADQLQTPALWNLTADASVNNGLFLWSKSTNGGSYESLKAAGLPALVNGEMYVVKFTVSNYINTGSGTDSGQIWLGFSGGVVFNYGNGDFELIGRVDDLISGDYFYFQPPSVLAGTVSFEISNLSIKAAPLSVSYKLVSLSDWFKAAWNKVTSTWDAL